MQGICVMICSPKNKPFNLIFLSDIHPKFEQRENDAKIRAQTPLKIVLTDRSLIRIGSVDF